MVALEREFLVHYERPLCVSLPAEEVSVRALKCALGARTGVPVDRLELLVNGLRLEDDEPQADADTDAVPVAPVVIRARLTDGLLGGKGGFGAMLRSQGKGAAGKATTNFGACRDLHGRRLRHVNQEIAMQKWRDEAGTREERRRQGIGEREVVDEETPSGIPGWYLATPSWADGIRKSYMKRRRNTVLCRNWVAARADGRMPPPHAPRWWGCPRGRDCDFAHGEEELRGEGLTELKRQKKVTQSQQQQQALDRYVNYESEIKDDIHAAIRQGLQQRRQASRTPAPATALGPEVALAPTMAETTSEVTPAAAIKELPDNWLVPVEGSLGATFKHGLCELRGQGNFGTATAAPMVSLTTGKWYYEVKLITDDIIQLGWADATFTANSETGDGVGDHARSWSYDGARQLKWTSGLEAAYGDEWSAGDIVGCLLDLDAGLVEFSRNGLRMGVAFDKVKVTKAGFFPAISVEKTEIVIVNVGSLPLLYKPEDYRPVAETLPSFSKTSCPGEVAPPADEAAAVAAEVCAKEIKTSKAEDQPRPAIANEDVPMVDLDRYDSAAALEGLGLDALKQQLHLRRLKCGGTLEQRAARLFSARGKRWEEIDPKHRDFKAAKN